MNAVHYLPGALCSIVFMARYASKSVRCILKILHRFRQAICFYQSQSELPASFCMRKFFCLRMLGRTGIGIRLYCETLDHRIYGTVTDDLARASCFTYRAGPRRTPLGV